MVAEQLFKCIFLQFKLQNKKPFTSVYVEVEILVVREETQVIYVALCLRFTRSCTDLLQIPCHILLTLQALQWPYVPIRLLNVPPRTLPSKCQPEKSSLILRKHVCCCERASQFECLTFFVISVSGSNVMPGSSSFPSSHTEQGNEGN